MTIASQTSRVEYTGNSSTTAFSVPFYFAANADIKVYLRTTAGVSTLQVLGTNYTLTGATLSAGGTCTFVAAPTTGYTVTIYRDPALTQTTSYNNNDPFPAASHELALDKALTIDQRTRDMVSRAVHLDDSDTAVAMTLPTVELRKGKLAGFDATTGAPIAIDYSKFPYFPSVLAAGTTTFRSLETRFAETFNVLDFGAVADGAVAGGVVSGTNNTTAFQAAITAASVAGGVVVVPSGKYAVGPLTGASNVIIKGLGHLPGFGTGAMLLNRQTGAGTGPMFSFGVAATGWGFSEILFDGNNILQPAIKTVDSLGNFSSFDFHINKCTFKNCHPAIHGIACFDAWVTECVFKNNGNMASGTGAQKATIYLATSALTSNGNNTWHIDNNFIETATGRGIWITGAAFTNQGIFITNNHFEGLYPTGGYEHLYLDGISTTNISSNFMLGTSPSTPIIVLTAGSHGNIITNNSIGGAGFYNAVPVLYYPIVDGGSGDIIANNAFVTGTGAPANVWLGATSSANTVTGNKSYPLTVQSVVDAGTDNSVYANDTDFLNTYTPTIAFTGGTGVSSSGLVCGWSREGSKLFIHLRFAVNFTTIPSQISFTLPNSKTLSNYSAVFGVNVTNTKAVTAYGSAGANTMFVVYAAGGVGVTTTGDLLTVSGYVHL